MTSPQEDMQASTLYSLRFFIAFAICVLLAVIRVGYAQSPAFEVVPLGIRGGSDESNLSCYAVSAAGDGAFVCLDAGSVRSGIEVAIRNHVWAGDPANVLRDKIKGYLISHPHLDHVSGLILNSPDDSAKPIYGIESCLTVIRDKYFTWQSWANFANEGDKPTLNKYTYKTLIPETPLKLDGTSLTVTPFLLSHVNPYNSTAFLVQGNGSAILYLGDTGADRIEKSDKLGRLWTVIAPLIKDRKLKAIFIEVSFSNAQPDHLLFGHLTPKLLMEEMEKLAALVPSGTMKDFSIVVTHMKPAGDRVNTIVKELDSYNNPKLKLVYPEQGKKLSF
ncbi:MAG: 3',5'-cyclic-nucleotide phosphodiesterase [Chryseolinea sp.]